VSSNAIASGSAILTANADGLASGLDKAAKDVKSWGTKVGGVITSTFSGKGGVLGGLQNLGGAVTGKLAGLATAAKGLLSGAGMAIGTMIGGPIGGAIGGAVGSAIGSIGETVVGALGAPFEKLDLFAKINKQAQSLGVSASQFQGLTAVMGKAGIEGDQVAGIFATMGKSISDVAAGKGKGAALAFQSLGLDAEKLRAMKPDEQFLAIADAFAKMPAGADQASAAVHLFGGNAAALLPELQKGGTGIQAFIEQQKKVGAVLSDDQLQAAANASKAWKQAKLEISSTWEGLVNRATLIAAPVISFVAKAVSKIFQFVQPVFDWVGRAVSKVADITTAVFEQLDKWFAEGVKWLQELGQELFGFAGEWPSVQDVIVSVFRTAGVAGAYTWDTIKAGAGLAAVAIGKVIGFVGDLAGQFKGTFKDIASAGADAARALGMDDTAAMFDRVGAAADSIADKINGTGAAIQKWGQNAFDSWGSSAAQFNKWLDKALAKKGKLDEAGTGAAAGGPVASPAKFAAALAPATKEAYSMVLKNDFGLNQNKDVAKEQLKEHKKANKLNQKQLDEQKKTNAALANVGVT
jgi:hypothetical protein